MGQRKLDPRLSLVAGLPLVVLAVLAVFALMVGTDASGAEAADALRSFGVLSLTAAAIGGVLVAVLGPRIDGSAGGADGGRGGVEAIDGLADAAQQLAEERLPALKAAIADGGEMPSYPSFGLAGLAGAAGEVGRLLDEIEAEAYEVAAVQRQADQRQVGELVVNLVRRNQSLLDQQLETIDDLETTEQDPDRLEQLYGLDLLATRMRRNAESLLVLAGGESPRRRNGPVPAVDIVRVAVSEIQHYSQVTFGAVDEAVIAPAAVVDIAHLLSELLENATTFSPPDSPVTVNGERTADGYRFSVIDGGIGMTADQLDTANETLSRPPELSLELSRALGLNVVGRLAQRHGINVELLTPGAVGTEAVVTVPASLLVGAPSDAVGDDAPEAQDETDAGLTDVAAEVAPPATATDDEPAGQVDDDHLPDQAVDTPLAVRRKTDPVDTATDSTPSPPATSANSSSAALARLLGKSTAEIEAPTTTPDAADSYIHENAEPEPELEAEPAPELEAEFEVEVEVEVEAEADTEIEVDSETGPEREIDAEAGAAVHGDTVEAVEIGEVPEADETEGFEIVDDDLPDAETVDAPTATEANADAEGGSKTEGGSDEDGPSDTMAEPDGPPPESLHEALPSGAELDDGIQSLLAPGSVAIPPRAKGGDLTRRDRSTSYAPEREGRAIPDQGAPVAASNRSPEEIRDLLSRYRDARKGAGTQATADGEEAASDNPDETAKPAAKATTAGGKKAGNKARTKTSRAKSAGTRRARAAKSTRASKATKTTKATATTNGTGTKGDDPASKANDPANDATGTANDPADNPEDNGDDR